MATALTWLSADQLFDQTRSGVYSRAQSLSNAASEGISDWVSIRKDIAKAFNDYSTEQDVVPFLQQARKAGALTISSWAHLKVACTVLTQNVTVQITTHVLVLGIKTPMLRASKSSLKRIKTRSQMHC